MAHKTWQVSSDANNSIHVADWMTEKIKISEEDVTHRAFKPLKSVMCDLLYETSHKEIASL